MTGFGRAEISLSGIGCLAVEIQTLNHRFLEIECQFPEGFRLFEELVRTVVTQSVRRGRVKVSLFMKKSQMQSRSIVQIDVARDYVAQLKRLKQSLKLSGSVTLEMVAALPELMVKRENALPTIAQTWPPLKKAIRSALGQVVKMRVAEGKRLANVFSQVSKSLDESSKEIRRRLPVVESQLRNRFISRLKTMHQSAELSMKTAADPAAIVSEAASFIQSMDVSEELARLQSHLVSLKQTVRGNGNTPGRKMDFLAQELHREVNTLGSKMRDVRIVQIVMTMKSQIEKLREQAANIE